MADALTQDAPLKKSKGASRQLTNEEGVFLPEYQFDVDKKYMFELAVRNPERELPVIDGRTHRPMPHQEFKPYQNVVFTSQIVWNGQRRNIRYYDGCTTLFVDEQPKDKETVDQLIKQTKKRHFNDGKFGVFGDERLLLIYMMICSWNVESKFRTRTADAIFRPTNADKKAEVESQKLDQMEEALELAKKASTKKMMIHASYLGVATTDWDSGNELSGKAIRTAYRKEAINNPKKFIESYGDTKIEIRYYLNKAWESGLINNKNNPNKAAWQSGTEICSISGLKTQEAIVNALFEHSQTEEGEEFLLQLKSLNESK